MTDGAVRFARYAYPPNSLGLCGPADSRALLEYGASGAGDGGLRQLAKGFEGAWPYLQLIASANAIGDPLDARVVEAYWLGNTLLDRVGRAQLGNSLDDRFRRRLGPEWTSLVELVEAGAHPHHNFHVFAVYPWAGLLRGGHGGEPLRILDRCRIRWGEVQEVVGDQAVVLSRELSWGNGVLALGPGRAETVTWRAGGLALGGGISPGVVVSMHWDWVCEILEPARLRSLRDQTRRQLDLVNNSVRHPGPAAVLS